MPVVRDVGIPRFVPNGGSERRYVAPPTPLGTQARNVTAGAMPRRRPFRQVAARNALVASLIFGSCALGYCAIQAAGGSQWIRRSSITETKSAAAATGVAARTGSGKLSARPAARPVAKRAATEGAGITRPRPLAAGRVAKKVSQARRSKASRKAVPASVKSADEKPRRSIISRAVGAMKDTIEAIRRKLSARPTAKERRRR